MFFFLNFVVGLHVHCNEIIFVLLAEQSPNFINAFKLNTYGTDVAYSK